MKKAFYYLRKFIVENDTGHYHPYACVCILKSDDGKISRGISLCSEKDTFSKRIGRSKAYGYAIKGLKETIYKRNVKNAWRIAEEIVDGCTFSNATSYPQSMLLFDGEKFLESNMPITDFEKSLVKDIDETIKE